ncbi:MAG TPA: alpha-amylase family glycosyl hydrolase [Planococcus sp. (in: firmicutes)]|nr:alpha-amylase family glycosyl hydrolase [Planococcus sp. (in: firmicutes)]
MKAKWLLSVLIGALVLSPIEPAAAAEERSIDDEIIYDVLVDRYFNKKIDNDFEVSAQDPAVFSGGDFAGLSDQMMHIKDMGFTMMSIGPVFATSTYDGKTVLDYSQLERHFGTEEELMALIDQSHKEDMKVMVDIPTQTLSPNHAWAAENPEWFTENADGTLALDTSNSEVQRQLVAAIGDFIKKYDIDGLRLLESDRVDAGFIQIFSKEMKNIRNVYLINDQESDGITGMDAVVLPGAEAVLRNSYKNFDQDSSGLPGVIEESTGDLIRVDSLLGSRFTADAVKEKGFPPTRWRLIMTQLLTMPGIPVVQYGSETAMNGEALPESHQIMDLAVEEELIEHITNLNSLRNSSEAMRTGDTEVLHEEDGWIVYKRSNEEEMWIVAINNSSSTKSISIPATEIGSDKEMRGLFESDVVRQKSNGDYRITLDREIADTFHVTEEKGLNTAYLAALAVLYVLFMLFIWFVWRKGKQRKADEAAKNK